MPIEKFPWDESSNFGAGGEARLLIEVQRRYNSADRGTCLESVYRYALEIAERHQIPRVVDLGTGTGRHLRQTFTSTAYELLQIDFSDHREHSGEAASPEFLAINFESARDLQRLIDRLDDEVATLFVLSHVIEHLIDPRWLLRAVRKVLKRSPQSRLLLATPDRLRTDGFNSNTVPDDPTRVRQWSAAELSSCLEAWGFQRVQLFHAKQDSNDTLDQTIVALVGCDPNDYTSWLETNSLPPSTSHMVITTEHALAESSGAIGSFYEVAERVDPINRLVLFCGTLGLPADWRRFCASKRWIHASQFGSRAQASAQAVSVLDREEILEATRALLFLYDEIRLVEYQDYLGVGVHVAEATRTGLLPPDISVVAYAHESGFSFDHANGELSADRPVEIDLYERLSLEHADSVYFPSKFLRDLYIRDWGLCLREHHVQPYPIEFPETEILPAAHGKIDTLILQGRQESKSQSSTLEAITLFFTKPKFASLSRQIKKIFFVDDEPLPHWISDLKGLEIVHGRRSQREVATILEEHSKTSLVLFFCRSNNQAFAVAQIISASTRLLAIDTEQLRELIPDEFHDEVLFEKNREKLLQKLIQAIQQDAKKRCSLILDLKSKSTNRWRSHCTSYSKILNSQRNPRPTRTVNPKAASTVAVIVPNYNGTAEFLRDTITGLRHSLLRPAQIVFVDDCSAPENLKLLQQEVGKASDLNISIVTNSVNLGLSASRNRALARIDTDFVCAHDNDNLILNTFLSDACAALEQNPDADAVACWMRTFADGEDWSSQATIKRGKKWKPYGPDIGIGMSQNTFGDALSVYRTCSLKELGGWDESSKGLWEDWQLFLKMTVIGRKLLVLPKYNFLYRIRVDSMLRTYPLFPGALRLSKSLVSLPANQRHGVIRVASAYHALKSRVCSLESEWRLLTEERGVKIAKSDQISSQIHALTAENQRLRAIESSTTWQATRFVRSFLTKNPRLRSIARLGVQQIRKILHFGS